MSLRRIAVTGADGYIGRHVVVRLADSGVSMSRRLAGVANWKRFDLSDPNPELPTDISAVIHLAADIRLRLTPQQELANLQGLLAAAKQRGAAFVYVSSQSAKRPRGEYGKRKAIAETFVLDAGGTVVRPGLVVGGRHPKGLAAQLLTLSRLPFLPDLGVRAKVQPIHVGILADALLILARKPSRGVFELASEATTLRSLIEQIGEARHGRRPLFLPVPARLVEIFCGSAQRGLRASMRQMLDLHPMVDQTSSLGLAHPDSRVLGFTSNRPLRRALLVEGSTLLKLVGCPRPLGQLSRQYARIIEQDLVPSPVSLRPMRNLGAAAVIARRDRKDLDELRRRLELASALFEFTPRGAESGMRFCKASRLGTFLSLSVLAPAALFDVIRVAVATRRPDGP